MGTDEQLRNKLNIVAEIGTAFYTCKGINELDVAGNLTGTSIGRLLTDEVVKYGGTKALNATNKFVCEQLAKRGYGGDSFLGQLAQV